MTRHLKHKAMAKQQQQKKTTTTSTSKYRTLNNRSSNFTVTQNKKTVKPTTSDSSLFNAIAKSSNGLSKFIKKPLKMDTLKKKK